MARTRTDQASLTLAQLRERYVVAGRPMPRDVEQRLKADSRAGAAALLKAVARRKKANRAEGQRLRKMLRYERERWDRGVRWIAGVDEAGMSPLAGPVTAAAVILPVGCRIREVDDSKKLDESTRNRLAAQIKDLAVAWAIGHVQPNEIDELNIYYAGLEAMRRAVVGLSRPAEELLVDARTVPDVSQPQLPLIKGDARSLSIAAASILAKTTRDNLMKEYAAQYPGYGFEQHKGYPVPAHKAALLKLGATPIHRRSFEAVRVALATPDATNPPEISRSTT